MSSVSGIGSANTDALIEALVARLTERTVMEAASGVIPAPSSGSTPTTSTTFPSIPVIAAITIRG